MHDVALSRPLLETQEAVHLAAMTNTLQAR
jgi:hypothetical protein